VGTSTPSRSRVIRFGVFELDVRSGELRKSGVRIGLQVQPLKLLECLLEHPGEVVTRDELRRRLWPDDTFVDFEQGVNAAVKRLRETLADSAESPRFVETLPRRGYRFIAPVERDGARDAESPAPAAVPGASVASVPAVSPPAIEDAALLAHVTAPRSSRWRRAAIGMSVVGIVSAVSGWAWLFGRTPPGAAASPLPPHVMPLTTLAGSEDGPTFSPDGSHVAFAWEGDAQDNSDIYVTLVGSSEVRRLTTDAARDFAPQWSPDGRQIAYVRANTGMSQQVRLMSSLGGSDRMLSDFPVWAPIAWSPDGRYIAAGRAIVPDAVGHGNGIHIIPVAAGEPRPLTPVEGAANDWSPAFSPDGRRIAYASCKDWQYRSNCHVQVQDLDASFAPSGPPRRLTRRSFWTFSGLTWSRDATFIVFSAREGGLIHLWRVDADGAGQPERIDMAGIDVTFPVMARVGERLAYSRSSEDEDLYHFEPPGSARPIAQSSLKDTNAQFSPDGRRIAFCSARSGDALEIWVAGADGSRPERLTRGPGTWQCSPSWSPDGTRIAFDSRADDGTWHVWTIGVEGGVPQQITAHAGDQARPTWSRDGRWIYFMWKRDGADDIWRTRGPGGPVERVTQGGSVTAARESPDGTGVWYKRDLGEAPLFFQPLVGGAARLVVPCVAAARFSVGPDGVYYMPCPPAGSRSHDGAIRVLNPTTGQERLFATLTEVLWPASGRTDGCFAISPDGRTLLYSRLVNRGADLMLIKNFR
jgi:Tol biopolymer transport system component/DNA-binding winged helix-turn-helix (wHTH) protein